MYQITYENEDIVIRINKDSVGKSVLANLLAYLEMAKIRSKSALTKSQAEKLAKEIDKNVWEKIKDKYIKG